MIYVVILEAKNLWVLETAIGIAKYESSWAFPSSVQVVGFAVHGIFRKRYYAIVIGHPEDLKKLVAYTKHHERRISAYYSDFKEGQVFDEKLGDWKDEEILPTFKMIDK